ncbi:hypothetical protein BT93_A0596 [Corymbia citriodora subsp. variegata]|nr:hypothetical protein BT93_A0596 [Corymbia citriodora subsp. variegata]
MDDVRLLVGTSQKSTHASRSGPSVWPLGGEGIRRETRKWMATLPRPGVRPTFGAGGRGRGRCVPTRHHLIRISDTDFLLHFPSSFLLFIYLLKDSRVIKIFNLVYSVFSEFCIDKKMRGGRVVEGVLPTV